MSNIDPGVTIDSMTSNLALKIDPETKFIYAKISGRFPNFGTLYLNGVKVIINSQVFIQIYPG
jgi:hypothetical protein